jgi:hypothetical protein
VPYVVPTEVQDFKDLEQLEELSKRDEQLILYRIEAADDKKSFSHLT